MLTFKQFEELNESKHKANMSARDMSDHLKGQGWKLERTQGSHDIWAHEKAKHKIAVPRHKGDLASGTVRQMVKSSTVFDREMA